MVTGALDYLGKISVKKKTHLRTNAYGSGLLVLVDKVSAHKTVTPISPLRNPML